MDGLPRPALRPRARLLLGLAIAVTLSVSLAVPARGQEPEPGPPVISPVGEHWTLLVNLGDAASPAALLASLDDWVTAAFTFNPASGAFRTYRAGLPALSDLTTIESGQAFWAFVPSGRLGADITFWEQPAGVRNVAQELRPGFNLVPWTGAEGVPIAEAIAGLPVRRAYSWDPVRQRFDVWDPALPDALRADIVLEYGQGLWIDLDATQPVTWEQP